MRPFVIGTAGHVDHGKTMLVKALTGVDTDRLKEEKERGISIELGFAPLKLPNGGTAAIVDVPGHERFIKNMLAGVAGIDMVLLVIAADEGVMPQTREHLDILRLLKVQHGIVVLTKIDLVDSEWLELVEEEVREFLQGSFLADAPIIRVSAVTGEGLPRLFQAIEEVAARLEERPVFGPARLPVDRVFSVTGFGTVVTGTLVQGELVPGQELEILPSKKITRVRNLQVHGRKVERAKAGQRVAVNLAGVEVDELERGFVLATPGFLTPSYRMDLSLYLLEGAEKPLQNRTRVRFHVGAKEAFGRVVLLDREELQPGEEAYAQIVLEEPVTAAAHDRYVIRTYSPARTIGGGEIIDPVAPRHKRFRPEVIEQLKIKEKGSPAELITQFLASRFASAADEVAKALPFPENIAAETLAALVADGRVVKLTVEGKDHYLLGVVYQQKTEEIKSFLADYHQRYPLRPGYNKEEFRSRFFPGLAPRFFQQLLQRWEEEGVLKVTEQYVALAEFLPRPTPEQEEKIRKVEQEFLQGGFQPPDWPAVVAKLGFKEEEAREILHYLTAEGILVKMSEDIYFHRETVALGIEKIKSFLRERGEILIAEARDLLGTSRKYALPFMEYLDREKITRRVGDKRILGREQK